jgi:hypothetical protein
LVISLLVLSICISSVHSFPEPFQVKNLCNPGTRRSWKDIIQALKESNSQPRLVYPAKLSFLIEGETKTFHEKENLKEFATTKTELQKILKGLLHIEEETRVRPRLMKLKPNKLYQGPMKQKVGSLKRLTRLTRP